MTVADQTPSKVTNAMGYDNLQIASDEGQHYRLGEIGS